MYQFATLYRLLHVGCTVCAHYGAMSEADTSETWGGAKTAIVITAFCSEVCARYVLLRHIICGRYKRMNAKIAPPGAALLFT